MEIDENTKIKLLTKTMIETETQQSFKKEKKICGCL